MISQHKIAWDTKELGLGEASGNCSGVASLHIYVDESGSFVLPPDGGHRFVGAVAVAIPSGQRAALFRRFRKMSHDWPIGSRASEIKGSHLSERQIADVIRLLASFDATAETVLTDMGSYTEAKLREFQVGQADKLIEHITPEHSRQVVAELNRMRAQCLATPLQLFVQAFLMILLLPKILQTLTIYYSFRLPPELGRFDWMVDAKDKKITTMEELWSSLMLPILQTEGFEKPFVRVVEGNYQAFRRFQIRESTAPASGRRHLEWLKSKTPKAHGTEYVGVDLGKIFRESFRFADSKQEPGLQLVDIIVNALCRAFNGKLGISGWGEIGSLFVAKSKSSIQIVKLDPNSSGGAETLKEPYTFVLRQIEMRCKSMFPPNAPDREP